MQQERKVYWQNWDHGFSSLPLLSPMRKLQNKKVLQVAGASGVHVYPPCLLDDGAENHQHEDDECRKDRKNAEAELHQG
nr:hypothetical protein [Tanacetum cinerariifolium]